MIRIGWFCPVSSRTGIARYASGVLEQLHAAVPRDQLDVVIFHPPTEGRRVPMPYPTIALDEGLIGSDFHALFDIAVYHLGNNDLHHREIYAALLRHPGIVVLHDHVYQHYLAGVSWDKDHFAPGFGALVHEAGGQDAFDFLSDSGVLDHKTDAPRIVPWEEQWATTVPLGNLLAQLGSAVVVHSAYAESGLGPDFPGPVRRLFMPRPDAPEDLAPIGESGRIHLVCGGHIGPTKGLRLLVDAFALDPGLEDLFRVTIAGFGSAPAFLDELRDMIREEGLGRTFELVVDPDKDDFAAVMASADIFYNLRYPNTEGASLSLVEQLTYRRPVIAYRSGCFAEVPDTACYFLDKVGDVGALADLLGRIGAGRAELAERGAAAWDTVRERTSARYAQELVAFIEENGALLARRDGLARSRSQGRLPQPSDDDRIWLRDLATARIRFQNFYSGRLFLPPKLTECDAVGQLRYLMRNLLHWDADFAFLRDLAPALAALPTISRMRLFGALIHLTAADDDPSFPPPSPEALRCMAQGDPLLWRILLQLAPEVAVPAAFGLLGIAGESEDDEADGIKAVIADAKRGSSLLALISHVRVIQSEGPPRPDLASILSLFEAEAERRPLEPIADNAEIVAYLRTPDAYAAVATTGFHPVETVGIWTAAPEATLRLRLPEGLRATLFEAHAGSLVPEVLVVFEIREEATQQCEKISVTCTPASQGIRLPLPGFSGEVRISIRAERVSSPAECGISDDTRKLGIRLFDLRLAGMEQQVDTPVQIKTARGA